MALDVLGAIVKGLIPGSIFFFLEGAAVSWLLMLTRSPRLVRWGRRLLGSLVAFYVVLSTPLVSRFLLGGLTLGHSYPSLHRIDDAAGARVIVALSNGVLPRVTPDLEYTVLNTPTSYNVLEAARLYRLLAGTTILVSGGPPGLPSRTVEATLMADALQSLGVPAEHIVVEGRSQNTWQQGVFVAEWLRAHGNPKFVLVTSPDHLRRAVGVLSKQGLAPINAVSGPQDDDAPIWLPTTYALDVSRAALYEYAACVLYWWRGWM